jgi:oxalate decarboxylase
LPLAPNYHSGDVGFVPRTLGHYIQNIGSVTVRLINVFNRPKFEDISLNQWMALTPPDLVRGRLNLDDTVIGGLRRTHRADRSLTFPIVQFCEVSSN